MAFFFGFNCLLPTAYCSLRQSFDVDEEAIVAALLHAQKELYVDRIICAERRSHRERRLVNLGPPHGSERRHTPERRSGRDRRNRG